MNSIVDHTYIINLDRRTDRKQLMIHKMSLLNETNYEFFSAIDGHDTKYNDLYKICKNVRPNISRGSLGLTLTYIRLLEDIYKKQYKKVLILEDDVNAHKNYNFLIQNISTHTDVLWLGANQLNLSAKQKLDSKNGFYHVDRYNPTFGTYSIIISRETVIKLMKIINNKNIANLEPVDNILNIMIRQNKLSGVVVVPHLFIPNVTESDNIGSRNQSAFAKSRRIKMSDYNFINKIPN